MFFVGLDIHSKHISICVLSETGQVIRRAKVRSVSEMMQILEGLSDRFEVCYEASCGYGYYHDLLRPLASRVLVAHPGQLALIFRSKNKNDRKDAERLAKLLYLGEVPTVHVPSIDVRTWRELINCRSQVIAKRTRAKNAVRALLRGAGLTAPKKPGLWTKSGVAWLRPLPNEGVNMATEAQCRRALELFEDQLSKRKNVVGLGIVPAGDESPLGRGHTAIAVYVAKKLPSNRLSKKDVVPRHCACRLERAS